MNLAFDSSASGLNAQEKRLATIANNIANANTVGFKRDRLIFEDGSYQMLPGSTVAMNNNPALSGVQLGTGTRLIGSQKDFSTGLLTATGQGLDVAIDGLGFLQVTKENGDIAYTRNGQLQLNAEGQLVNMQGLPLEPEIAIPPGATKISISGTGVVSVTESDGTLKDVGQIELASFVNPAGLLALGGNLYQETTASGAPTVGTPNTDAFGKLKQGSVEASNVQVVEEMVAMIEAQRIYEMAAKTLEAASKTQENLTQAVR